MAEKVGSVYIEIQAKMGSLEKDLIRLEEKLNGVNRKGKETGSTLATMGKFLSGAAVTGAIIGLGKAALTASAQMEQNRVAFTTMLGSAEKASALLKEMTAFASTTPFELPEIVEGGKKLLAFGFAAKDIIPTLTKLGDVSAGLSIPIGELSQIYGKMKVAGVIQAEELNVLTERGIPIFSELAKVMKVNENQIKKMGSEGKITFSDLEKAFTNMTKEGSQFGGLMIAQANTLGGKWSNLQDAMGKALTSIGNSASGLTGEVLKSFTIALNALAKTEDNVTKSSTESLGFFTSMVKRSNNAASGLNERLADIVKNMSEMEQTGLRDSLNAASQSTGGISGQFDEILKKYGDINSAAVLYVLYSRGAVKLTEQQVAQLEKIVSLGLQMSEEEQNINAIGAVLGQQYADTITMAYEAKKKIDAAEKDTQTKRTSGFSKGKSEAQKFYEELVKIANATDEAGVLAKRLAAIDAYEVKLNESWVKGKTGTERYNKEIETITLARIKTEEEAEKLAMDKKISYFEYGFSAASDLSSQLSQLSQMNASNQTAVVDAETTKKLEKLDEEYNAEVERINGLAISEEEKNEKLKALDEQKARDEKIIQDKADKEKRKIAREAAKQQKMLSIFDTLITIPQAAFAAFNAAQVLPFPANLIVGAASAAQVTALGMIKLKMIQDQPLPALAEGGIIPAVPGGNKYTIGEAGSDEAVIPLNDQTLSRLASMINKAGNTSGQSPVLHVYINDDYKGLYNASKNGVVMIDKRAVV